MLRDVLLGTMRNPSLHKVQVLAFLLDEYWKPGISIRATDLVLGIHESRRIKISAKTMYNILDSLVGDEILTLSNPMREKTYSINEQKDAGAMRNEILALLGIDGWANSGLSGPASDPQSRLPTELRPKRGLRK